MKIVCNFLSMKAQGAFEYMVSYGWAILVVVVLGILLFSLGVFNPSQTPTATGFVYLKPISWSITGNPNADSANVTIAFENLAGQNLILLVNDSVNQSIKFRHGSSKDCYFNSSLKQIVVTDSANNNLEIAGTKIGVPVGGIITIIGTIGGQTGSNCGGLKSATYRYNVQLVSIDEYGVTKSDLGLITGKYV